MLAPDATEGVAVSEMAAVGVHSGAVHETAFGGSEWWSKKSSRYPASSEHRSRRRAKRCAYAPARSSEATSCSTIEAESLLCSHCFDICHRAPKSPSYSAEDLTPA